NTSIQFSKVIDYKTQQSRLFPLLASVYAFRFVNIITSSSYLSNDLEDKTPLDDHVFQKYSSLKAGHPVLRVEET
ncbi:hypothetical protein Ccrd_002737, partial [Cynara cardunculus var. scolymus]